MHKIFKIMEKFLELISKTLKNVAINSTYKSQLYVHILAKATIE